MYDVLHDGEYRKDWDPTMSESYDIARLSDNADVGYYSCKDPISSICVCPDESDPVDTCWECRPDTVSPSPQAERPALERESLNIIVITDFYLFHRTLLTTF